MTKRLFTKKEQEQLKCNPYVKAVSEKAITYTDEFKRHFITENEKGKLPREIFEEAGLDIELIGMERIEICRKTMAYCLSQSRCRRAYKIHVKSNSGTPT